MARWNQLLQEVRERQSKFHKRKIDGDKPDGGDRVAFANSLTSKKKQEKEGKNEQ